MMKELFSIPLVKNISDITTEWLASNSNVTTTKSLKFVFQNKWCS